MTENYRFSKDISEKLNRLNELDNWHAILGIFEDMFWIIVAVSLYFVNPFLYPLSILIIGARQGALANLAHDAGHRRLARSKWLNNFIGKYLTGYLIMQAMGPFIDSHVKLHHIYLGDKKKDPDYAYHIRIGLYKKQKRKCFINQYVLKPFYLATIFHYIKNIFSNRAPVFKKYPKESTVMFIYLSLIVFLFVYFGIFKYLLLFWVIPFVTVFPTIGWFVDMVEHYPLVSRGKTNLNMTRNRFSHPIESFIFNLHNENYHLVHHLRPDIPFWQLPKAHEVMMQDQAYFEANQSIGGIFASANSQPSFIKAITKESRQIFQSNHRELI